MKVKSAEIKQLNKKARHEGRAFFVIYWQAGGGGKLAKCES